MYLIIDGIIRVIQLLAFGDINALRYGAKLFKNLERHQANSQLLRVYFDNFTEIISCDIAHKIDYHEITNQKSCVGLLYCLLTPQDYLEFSGATSKKSLNKIYLCISLL